MEIDENKHFIDSEATVGLHVYEYTGLGAREAYCNEDGKWILDSEQDYGNNFGGRNLWESAFAVTDVTAGEEGSISLDDLVLTYYGEDTGTDSRWTYWEGDEEKYREQVETKATLEVYDQDKSLLLFTPDMPGEYLISKKGISNKVDNDNREIREQAIQITVDSNCAGFYKETTVSHEDLLTTAYGKNCKSNRRRS